MLPTGFQRHGRDFQWLERAGTGRPVLYLHGAGGPRVSPALRAACEGRRLVVPVYPGFGYPPLPEVAGARQLSAALAALLSGLAGNFDVVAHSLGGHVALWLAMLEPGRVARLLLQCPAGFRRGPRPAGAAIQKYPGRVPPEPQYATSFGEAAALYRATGFDDALWAQLADLRAPTLVVHGKDDEILDPDVSRALARTIPCARLALVEDCGHAIETDQPQAFERIARQFLDPTSMDATS